MRTVKIAMLGMGNIGTGLYKILKENADYFEKNEGLKFEIKGILVRNLSKPRPGVTGLTDNPDVLLNDPEVEVVIETMGGTDPTCSLLVRALESGKTVVTANKEVVARHWSELTAAARKGNAGLYFEASVAGGIPIIRALNESMRSNKILEIMGILNGTTNYILSRMSHEGLPYNEVLSEAQRLGFAEPNPRADVEAIDPACKISILASLAFNKHIPIEKVFREGITSITDFDICSAREMGYVIKLVAIAKQHDDNVEVRVHPVLIPSSHPLAGVNGSYNAVFLRGNAVGDLMFYGKGAGDLPTGSSLVSDLLAACRNTEHTNLYYGFDQLPETDKIETNWKTEYYVRLSLTEKPGVLSVIAGILGKHGISLSTVIQKQNDGEHSTATIVFITYPAYEKSLRAAISEISDSENVISVDNIIRVEN